MSLENSFYHVILAWLWPGSSTRHIQTLKPRISIPSASRPPKMVPPCGNDSFVKVQNHSKKSIQTCIDRDNICYIHIIYT